MIGHSHDLSSRLSPLVVTPRPSDRETAIGYVLRLCSANGYHSPRAILNQTGIDSAYMIEMGGSAQVLKVLGAMDTASSERLQIRHVGTSSLSLLGTTVPGTEADLLHHKVCLLCLDSDGIFDASWHLKVVTHCSVHRCALVRQCASCGSALRLSRRSVEKCRCGETLRLSSLPDCSPEVADLLGLVRSSLIANQAAAHDLTGLGSVSTLPTAPLLSLIRRMLNFVAKSGALELAASNDGGDAQLKTVAQALWSWELGCEAVQAKLIQHDSPRPFSESREQDFKWLGSRANALTHHCTEQMLRSVEAFLGERKIVKRYQKPPPLGGDDPDWIPARSASSHTCMPADRLEQLIRMKILSRRGVGTGPHRHQVRLSEISRLQLSGSPGLTAEQATTDQSMCAPLFERLARSRIYVPRFITAQGGVYAVEDVAALKVTLADVRKTVIFVDRNLTVSDVFRSCISTQFNASGRIVQAVLDNWEQHPELRPVCG